MKQTINYRAFEQAFKNHDRLGSFPTGLKELFEALESYESDTGTEIELDVISLCCDYTETNWTDFKKDYPDIYDIDDLRNNTEVIMVDGDENDENPTFIYLAF